MRKVAIILSMILVFPIFNLSMAQQPPYAEWEKTYGGDGFDLLYCVEEVNDGYIAAGCRQINDIYYIWLIKVDKNGNLKWENFYFPDTTTWSIPTFLEKEEDGFIMAGETTEYTFIAKLDSHGEIEWHHIYPRYGYDGIYRIWNVRKDGDGYIGCGFRYIPIDIYIGTLFKLDEDGNNLWIKDYENMSNTFFHSISIEEDGYTIAGDIGNSDNTDILLLKTDKNGNIIWKKIFNFSSSDVDWSRYHFTDINGYTLCVTVQDYGAGSRDVCVIRTDKNGNMVWNETYGENHVDMTWSFEKCGDGYIICMTENYGGMTGGKGDIWIIKIDESGNMQWKLTFGGEKEDRAYCIKRTSDNGYIIAGRTESFRGSSDGYLIKISPDKKMPAPGMEVVRPKEGYIYLWNFGIPVPFLKRAIIIGKLNVEVNAAENVSMVEFFVDGKRMAVDDTRPFTYSLDVEKGKHILKIRCINEYGGSARELIKIWKI